MKMFPVLFGVKGGDHGRPLTSCGLISRDSWTYPYQHTPMGNPNISPT